MSQLGLGMAPDDAPPSDRRPRRERSGARPVLVAVAALLALGLALFLGLRSLGASANDYQGEGEGSATVVVAPGDSLRQIGRTLAAAGVVADEGSFVDAASSDPRAQSIAPGTYTLRQHMSGEAAVALMLDPSSRQVRKLVVPEGWRMERIVAAAAKATGLTPDALKESLSRAGTLGLPTYAEGSPEGFLFPATYEFQPGTSADTVVSAMLKRFDQAAAEADLENAAKAIGRTPLEVLTVASILEIEAGPQDYDKVARVIYNRLKAGMPLQLDSTVNYALGTSSLKLSAAQLKTDSPYNTYLNKGLPPGPIDSPGDAAIAAALNPATGPWLYFVTTDPKTKTTEFATTYADFLVLKKKFQANAG
ncbi:MAG: endolytic transglycosylase MltG [Actinomycetales bacterium]|nr:endolytic transglycosylase MltG [Actinomycetales bacterium]